jgi:hypothetical protein
MHIWASIARKAALAAWDLVVGQPISTIIIAGLAFIIVFFIARKLRGKEYANDWLFDAMAGLSSIILIGVVVFFAEILLFVPSKMMEAQQSQIADLTNAVSSLQTTNASLSEDKIKLQTSLNNDETVLKAVAVVTGTTNLPSPENIHKILNDIATMQHEMRKAEDILFGEKKTEVFSPSDTNRVTILISTNAGPRIFFKLKRPAIFSTIECMVQCKDGQEPMILNGEVENITWMTMTDLVGLDAFHFAFIYSIDPGQTNLVKTIMTNNDSIYFDGVRQIFNDPDN